MSLRYCLLYLEANVELGVAVGLPIRGKLLSPYSPVHRITLRPYGIAYRTWRQTLN